MTTENPLPADPAQLRAYMKSHYAFGLPNGSVRALLALGTFGSIWAWMCSGLIDPPCLMYRA